MDEVLKTRRPPRIDDSADAEVSLHVHGFTLDPASENHVRRELETFARRLKHRPDPRIALGMARNLDARRVDVDLWIALGPLGPTLVSHQAAEVPEHAVRLALDDVQRQLERRTSSQRGEKSYGVPSRREPRRPRRRSGSRPPPAEA